MRRIYEHLFVLFPKASLLDHWAAPKRKDPLLLYLVPCKLSHKTKQPICMIPRLDPDFFFSRERDPDPLTNYNRSTPRFSPIWRESYSCSYADSRPWLATCYNNVLTINLRFVTSSDILIYLRVSFSPEKFCTPARGQQLPVWRNWDWKPVVHTNFFRPGSTDLQLIVFHFNCDKST